MREANYYTVKKESCGNLRKQKKKIFNFVFALNHRINSCIYFFFVSCIFK